MTAFFFFFLLSFSFLSSLSFPPPPPSSLPVAWHITSRLSHSRPSVDHLYHLHLHHYDCPYHPQFPIRLVPFPARMPLRFFLPLSLSLIWLPGLSPALNSLPRNYALVDAEAFLLFLSLFLYIFTHSLASFTFTSGPSSLLVVFSSGLSFQPVLSLDLPPPLSYVNPPADKLFSLIAIPPWHSQYSC